MSYQCSLCFNVYVYRGNYLKHLDSHGVAQIQAQITLNQASSNVQSSEPNSSSRNKRLRCEPLGAVPSISEQIGPLPTIPEPLNSVPMISGSSNTGPFIFNPTNTGPLFFNPTNTLLVISRPMSTVPVASESKSTESVNSIIENTEQPISQAKLENSCDTVEVPMQQEILSKASKPTLQKQKNASMYFGPQPSPIPPPIQSPTPINPIKIYKCRFMDCTASYTSVKKLIKHHTKHAKIYASIDRLNHRQIATTQIVEQVDSSCGENVECQRSVDSHIEQSYESNQLETVATLENEDLQEDDYNTDMNEDTDFHDVDMNSLIDHDEDDHSIEAVSPTDTTDKHDIGSALTKSSNSAVLEDQNMYHDVLDETDMETNSPNLNVKPIGMETTKQLAKLEKAAKWILLLVKQGDGNVNLEKVETDFKEFDHLISELDDDDKELVDYWLIRKTLIWNEISKFKCKTEEKMRESRIDKKLDWMANRLAQRLSEPGLSSGEWTELKSQFETFAHLVTELERSGEMGMKWDVQYNRIRVEMQKRS